MKNNYTKVTLAVFLAFTISAQSASAMCMSFWNPERIYSPEEDMRAAVFYKDGIQNLIMQPEFSGDVEDFGLIVAVPSLPSVKEAHPDIFKDLENLTNPEIAMSFSSSSAYSQNEGSESLLVVEQKNVGDYTATVLKATDPSELSTWLDSRDYAHEEKDIENFQYYIDAYKHNHFVLLQVNTSVLEKINGQFDGKLSPIDLQFETNSPILPTRIMASADGAEVNLTLYTSSDSSLIAPGALVTANKKHTIEIPLTGCRGTRIECFSMLSWVGEYSAHANYFTRQELAFNTGAIEKDTGLIPMLIKEITSLDSPEVVGGLLDKTGIIPNTVTISNPSILHGGAAVDLGFYIKDLLASTNFLQRGSRGAAVQGLQSFLNDNVTGVYLKEDGIWGEKTADGVKKFQTQFGLTIDGIVGPQTRRFIRNQISF